MPTQAPAAIEPFDLGPADHPVQATVVITTRNRKDELARAVRSCVRQTACTETIVIDDASTDGSAEMVRELFPTVRLHVSPSPRGLVVNRNRAARIAKGPILFSLDDDAIFSTPHVVAQTLAEFDDPRIGAVAIPFMDMHKEGKRLDPAPDDRRVHVTESYVGTAHALRRDLFLELGGYRGQLFQMGEERDFCVRLLDAGYIVRLGRSDPIEHYESPKRDHRKMSIYSRRNDVLFGWHNAPMPYMPVHILGTTYNGLRFGLGRRGITWTVRGLCAGYGACLTQWGQRRPVSREAYRLNRRLRLSPKPGPTLDEIEDQLPPLNQHLVASM